MQNTPLLNMQQPAPQALAATKPETASGNQPAHDKLFQQQLAQRIEQKNQELRTHAKRQSNTAQQQKSATDEGAASSISADLKTEKTLDKRAPDDAPQQETLTAADLGKPDAAFSGDTQSPPVTQSILAQLQQIQPAHTPTASAVVIDSLPTDTGAIPAPALANPTADAVIADPDTNAPSGPRIGISPDSTSALAESSRSPLAGTDRAILQSESMSDAAVIATTAAEQTGTNASSEVLPGKISGTSIASLPMQLSATPAVTPAPATASQLIIQPHPGQEGWNQAIGERVMWMVGNAQQSATLMLNPPDMGPLQVVIHVHNDQADANFFSDRQEVRQALEDGMDNLRAMMKEAGINLGQANINQHHQASDFTARQPQLPTRQNEAQTAGEISTAAAPLRTTLGLVDTFA